MVCSSAMGVGRRGAFSSYAIAIDYFVSSDMCIDGWVSDFLLFIYVFCSLSTLYFVSFYSDQSRVVARAELGARLQVR